MPLCAILIPSRARFDRLLKTIQSVIASAGGDDFEIIIRMDFDDISSIVNLHRLNAYPMVRVVFGQRLGGYTDIDPVFNTEMAQLSIADWIWLLNDDAIVEGENWLGKLAEAPNDGVVVQPEVIQLGGSTYSRCDWTAFPCVPNQCWRRFNSPTIPRPADLEFYNLLNQQNHWGVKFLSGIKVSHQRDSHEALETHRKLT